MSKKSIGPQEVDAAFGAEQQADAAQYAAEGRRFRDKNTDDLKKDYIDGYRAAFDDMEGAGMRDSRDISSELILRGEELPNVKPEDREYAISKIIDLGADIIGDDGLSESFAARIASKLGPSGGKKN